MFKIFAILYLLLSCFGAYTGFAEGNLIFGIVGLTGVVLSLGLVCNVRFFGHLMAVFFLVLAAVTIAATLKQGVALDALKIARLIFYGGMAWWCFSWARLPK